MAAQWPTVRPGTAEGSWGRRIAALPGASDLFPNRNTVGIPVGLTFQATRPFGMIFIEKPHEDNDSQMMTKRNEVIRYEAIR